MKTSQLSRIRHTLAERYELLFPAPSEVRLMQILGATTVTIGRWRHKKTGRPLTFVLSRGHLLRSEKFRRSVVDGNGVLANDVRMAITIRGPEYERDVVAAYERDEYLKNKGWTIKAIPQSWLLSNPKKVRTSVLQFI